MNRKTILLLTTINITIVILGVLILVPWVVYAMPAAPEVSGAPARMTYQGYLTDEGGVPLNGQVDLRFRIYAAQSGETHLWQGVFADVDVLDGYFTVELTPGADIFDDPTRWLEVSVDDGSGYTALPRQQIGAVPYALQAGTVNLENVVIVAKSGGDYNTIQAAIDSITNESATNPYLVWVAPGVYNETVILAAYIHLQGAGQDTTIITSSAGNDTFPDTATLTLSGFSSLRDLTVKNTGTSDYNVAIFGNNTPQVLLSNVVAETTGNGDNNYGIYLMGDTTHATLLNVSASAANGSERIAGFSNNDGATAMLRGGFYTTQAGGENSIAYAIENCGELFCSSPATLDAEGVTAVAEGGDLNCFGLDNTGGSTATLRGGTFIGRGITRSRGIRNYQAGSTLDTVGVTVLAEGAASGNTGFLNRDGAVATLEGGLFTGLGNSGKGLQNGGDSDGGTTLALHATVEGDLYAAHLDSGALTLKHIELIGSVYSPTATPTCVAVTRGAVFGSTTCP